MRVATRGAPLVQRTMTGLWLAAAEPSGRVVTVRQALPGVAAIAEVRRELAREAAVLALLGPHEAVLGLLVDASEEPVPRLVMEGGELLPLARLLERDDRGFELPVALGIVLPLAEALAVAHERSIVHGAVSPEVILITDRGTPKLSLWAGALAPTIDAPPSIDELRDPAWIAPEVRMGEDPRASADVFALGCLLALLLRGRHPFAEDDDASKDSPPATPRRVLVPRLAESVPQSVPDGVAKVIARAIAKSPTERYDSASAFLSALARAAPVHARRSVGAALARRGWGKRRADEEVGQTSAASRRPPAIAPFLGVIAGLVLWAGLVELVAEAPAAPGAPEATPAGHLRILAHPWAAVSLDGEPLDTTPIGSPVAVRPGRHVLDFVHPRAPKVQRVVEVLSGQTVVVDVILDVPAAPVVDAGPPSP